MTKKTEPLPPGEYTMVIDSVRKVRNKPYKRIKMHVAETGESFSQIIKPELSYD